MNITLVISRQCFNYTEHLKSKKVILQSKLFWWCINSFVLRLLFALPSGSMFLIVTNGTLIFFLLEINKENKLRTQKRKGKERIKLRGQKKMKTDKRTLPPTRLNPNGSEYSSKILMKFSHYTQNVFVLEKTNESSIER